MILAKWKLSPQKVVARRRRAMAFKLFDGGFGIIACKVTEST